jgi:GcrA cell cycle regulator
MDWNDERIERLKRLWADGLSASQIAARLGGVTRSAVIGKSYRLCLAPRKSANPEQIKNKRRAAQLRKMERQKAIGSVERSPRILRINAKSGGLRAGTADDVARAAADWRELKAEMERQDGARTDLVALLDLEERQCRWPIGEPTRGFCGHTKVPGKSYCAGHLSRSCVRASATWLPPARYTPAVDPVVDKEFETATA